METEHTKSDGQSERQSFSFDEQLDQSNGKDGGAIDGSIDPTTIPGGDSGDERYVTDSSGNILLNRDGSPRRKRGRKPGQRTGTVGGTQSSAARNNQNLKASVDSLASMIGFAHLALASVSKCPELKLEENESHALANATTNVLREFDMTPDPKVVAIVGLITTASTIYGPRVYLISRRKAEEKEKKEPLDVSNAFNKPNLNVVDTGFTLNG